MMRLISGVCMMVMLAGLSVAQAQDAPSTTTATAIAEFDTPLYADGFDHWPYANPDAPKGGAIVLGAFGTFDSLNTYILRGTVPAGIGLVTDSLMVGSGDELSAAYGLIAERVEYPADKSWITFTLRPEARYHDGTPIVAEDFVFSFNVIREHGRPFLKSFYDDVEAVEALDDHRLKYSFKTRDTMKPLLIVSGSAPLPRHYWEARDITQTTLDPILGSGPYKIKDVDSGRSITYARVADYWAADLPVRRGLNNFDTIRYDYYRDETVLFEAFKSGDIDFRTEYSAKRWATGYDVPQIETGEMIKRTVTDHTPQGPQGFFINTRRDKFADRRVREALSYLFDFESVQRTIMFGQYKRAKSFFPNSDFGASGPPTPEELALLQPYADQLQPQVLTEAFEPPMTDGSGRSRTNFRTAMALFKEAGWQVQDGVLTHADSGPMSIEFLIVSPSSQRVTEPFVQALKRAGISATIRMVDSSQYQVRLDDFDFDIIMARLNFFPPPGTEMRSYYGSATADVRGSANLAGVKHPVADAMIEKMIAAETLDDLKAATRALDRVLLWNHYYVPQWYNDVHRIAYWDRFAYPDQTAKYMVGFPATWWVK